MTLHPAYGRKYNSEDEVWADWHSNKDFKIVGGPYINSKDFHKYCCPTIDTVTYFHEGLYVPINIGAVI